jgi:hypothetical protein
MVASFGDIKPQDDYTHPLGPEPNFNESMYFNFFDRAREIGGFVRMGNRANEGYAEVTTCLFLPGGPVLFMYQRPAISGNERFDGGGMLFEVVEPLVRLRTVYEGPALYLKDPTQMSEPARAFKENPQKQVRLELLHENVGPVYGTTGADRAVGDPETEFGRAHYEQHMHATGTLTVDGEVTEIDGLGLRDHSWGPRYWQALRYYRWLTCNFGPDFGLMGSEIVQHDGSRIQGGVIVRGQALERVRQIDIQTEFAPDSVYHQRFTAQFHLESGEPLTLVGTVKGFIPLRNRRKDMVTHIGEGMTEYRCGDYVGYGLSEYLDQVK